MFEVPSLICLIKQMTILSTVAVLVKNETLTLRTNSATQEPKSDSQSGYEIPGGKPKGPCLPYGCQIQGIVKQAEVPAKSVQKQLAKEASPNQPENPA